MSKSVKSNRPTIIDNIAEQVRVHTFAELKQYSDSVNRYQCLAVVPRDTSINEAAEKIVKVRAMLSMSGIFNAQIETVRGLLAMSWVMGVN